MQPSAGEPGPEGYFFHPVFKCCTYLPDLHNFLVGAILSDTDPAAQAGLATVEKRMAAGVGVTPLGLAQSPVYTLLYKQSDGTFGRSSALGCPHYLQEAGLCGIWRHRDSICATWFCKHVRGEVGRTFWIDSLRELLRIVEAELARWCVLELNPSDEMLRQLVGSASWKGVADTVTTESLDNRIDEKKYAALWGDWRGREAEFFRRSAQLVDGLSWTEVLALSGPNARAYAQLTQHAYAQLLSDDVPPALETGSFQLVHIQRGTTRVSSYNSYDPIDIPAVVMELLPYFDGRPTEEALAGIAEERGFNIEPDLLRKMVDFGLLVAKRPSA
jgi:hypothetical protein